MTPATALARSTKWPMLCGSRRRMDDNSSSASQMCVVTTHVRHAAPVSCKSDDNIRCLKKHDQCSSQQCRDGQQRDHSRERQRDFISAIQQEGYSKPVQPAVLSDLRAEVIRVKTWRLAEKWPRKKSGPARGRAKVRSLPRGVESLPVPTPPPMPPRSMAIAVVPVVVRPPPASKRTTNPSRLLDLTDLASRFRQTGRQSVGHRVGAAGEGQDRSRQSRHH